MYLHKKINGNLQETFFMKISSESFALRPHQTGTIPDQSEKYPQILSTISHCSDLSIYGKRGPKKSNTTVPSRQ
jgi:hypothetical protein